MNNKYQSKLKLQGFRDALLKVFNEFPSCGIAFHPDAQTFELFMWDDNNDYGGELEEGTNLSPQKLANW